MGVTGKAVGALQGLPFYNLIGGPLNACIRAQAEAAQTTVNFIQEVGLNQNEDGTKEAIYVYFTFVQNGRKVVISVPLLTIIPIPYIAINSVDINFKATVNGVESDSFTSENSTSYTRDYSKKTNKWWGEKRTTNLKTSYSSKHDSKSTRDSSFSVEATIDVAVHAGQESMPAGMAKILEMLGAAMDLCSPDGELTVNDTTFYVESGKTAKVIAQYKTPGGLYDTSGIMCSGVKGAKSPAGTENQMDKTVEFDLSPSDEPYIISCGDIQKVAVRVIKQTPAATTVA